MLLLFDTATEVQTHLFFIFFALVVEKIILIQGLYGSYENTPEIALGDGESIWLLVADAAACKHAFRASLPGGRALILISRIHKDIREHCELGRSGPPTPQPKFSRGPVHGGWSRSRAAPMYLANYDFDCKYCSVPNTQRNTV